MAAKNPYVLTAFIFVIILFVGRKFFHWGEISSAFVLLFFFLVTIGIRLDDIVKRIGATNDRLDSLLKLHAGSVCAPGVAGEPPEGHPLSDNGAVSPKGEGSST